MKVFLPIAPPVYSQQSIQRANYEISRAFEQADARYLSQGGGALTNVDPGDTPLTIIAAAAQTANLTEWQNSSSTALAAVAPNGNFRSISPSVPASAAASGSAGEIAWDAGFLYVCTATNTWKRAALSTW